MARTKKRNVVSMLATLGAFLALIWVIKSFVLGSKQTLSSQDAILSLEIGACLMLASAFVLGEAIRAWERTVHGDKDAHVGLNAKDAFIVLGSLFVSLAIYVTFAHLNPSPPNNERSVSVEASLKDFP